MALEAQRVNDGHTIEMTATAPQQNGDVLILNAGVQGMIGIVMASEPIAIGDLMTVAVRGLFEFDSVTTFSTPGPCDWDDTAKTIIPPALGDAHAGHVIRPRTGTGKVLVLINIR